MKNQNKLISAFLAATLGAGCAGELSGEPRNDDPPLGDLDALLEGAPKADEIPREGFKGDDLLPAKFTDIRSTQSAVKSQGRRGVCSIFSTVGYMEHLYIAAGHAEPDFSEQYLQWSAKFEVNSFPATSGSNANYNLQAINRFGVVLESVWPYEIEQWDEFDDEACDGEDEQPTRCYTNGHPTDEVKAADKWSLPRGRWLHPLDIKGHLKNREIGAVVGMTFFYQSWNHRKSELPTNSDYWDRGIVLAPNDEDRKLSLEKRAGHSIVIIGWDDDMEVQKVDKDGNLMTDDDGEPIVERGFYLFKNSWGTSGFGISNEHGAGYGWLSMDYVHEFGRVRIAGLPTSEHVPVLDEEICGDGIDNDDNGDTDCADEACAELDSCQSPDELSFTNDDALSIPDNDSTGVTSTIEVSDSMTVGRVTVELDIDHTYKGDLRVTLRKGGTQVVLHNRTGGGARDVKGTFEASEFAGEDSAGTWELHISDNAGIDLGTLNSWTLSLAE